MGIFISGSSMAGAFGGLLATGLSKIHPWGVHSAQLHAWRNIFFFEGLFTLIVGLAAPVFMPDRPENCHFLSDRERVIAAERLAREHKGVRISTNLPHSYRTIQILMSLMLYVEIGCPRKSDAQTRQNGNLQHPKHNLRPRIPLRQCLRPINLPLHAHHPKRNGLQTYTSPTTQRTSLRHCVRC